MDSLYEYLLKAWILFGDEEYFEMFLEGYDVVEKYVRWDPWFADVNLESGQVVLPHFSSLQLFWPGLQVLFGDLDEAHRLISSISKILDNVDFFPEAFNLQNGNIIAGKEGYPLRPEFIESLWCLYRATKEERWLRLGSRIVDSLQK